MKSGRPFVLAVFFVPLILSIGITPAFSIVEIDSPRKQMQNGIAAKDVVCKSGLVLMIRSSGDAACVTPPTAEKLANAGWGLIEKEATMMKDTTEITLTTDEVQSIAEHAFIYAYPMLENYRIMYGNMIDESSDEFLGSYNTLHNEEMLATPDDKGFVTPNADALYTYVWFDLRAEPMVVTLPPIEEDRYYTFQNVDYFSNNYFYMGTATTGNDGGTFLIAGPNWSGEVPDGIDDSVQSATEFNYVLERNQVKNNEDVPNANSIQKQFKIQSLSEFVGTAKPDSPPKIDFIPWNSEQGYSGDFVNYFNLILTWSEIPESEKSLFKEFLKIGINPGETVDWTTIDPQIKNAINEGAKTGFDKIKDNIPNIGTVVGDWLILDAYGDAKYHENNFLRRASGVLLGQYGNSMQEAIYPAAHPSNGIPYDGQKNNYEIKFSSEPPVGAFWSLTVYDLETQFLIDNPIDRYLINSSSDIQKNDDGSFVLYLQQEPPEDEKQSNWLPINDGSFYFGMRLYLPDQTIRDGLWEYPIIETIPKTHDKSAFEEAKMIAEDAYVFGFPLVMMDLTKLKMSNVAEAGPWKAPINQLSHWQIFPTADFRDIVRPNVDTLYSIAWLDLSDEPLVLHVPNTDDRYYLVPMLDAYSNVFVSPGKRTTGTGENDYVITGPFWSGTIPQGLIEIDSPTNLVWIAGRIQTNTQSDYENVNNIQKQMTLTPLSSFGNNYQPPKNVPVNSAVDMETPPVEKIRQVDPEKFYNVMANLMKDNPPTPEDLDLVKNFSKIGLVPGEPFDMENLDPKVVMAIEEGFKSGQQKIINNLPNMGPIKDGWMELPDSLARFGTDYLLRASVAMMGLGANWIEDASYPIGFFDNNGDILNGANKYVLHFTEGQIPPVNAFWSLTLYQDFFFYANSIDRYALGDRDELEFNEDGSLDIYIQHESPEGKESNWLPSPEGNYDFIMRLYWPQEAALDGTWQMPSIMKVDDIE